jgi:hypothetical protein
VAYGFKLLIFGVFGRVGWLVCLFSFFFGGWGRGLVVVRIMILSF